MATPSFIFYSVLDMKLSRIFKTILSIAAIAAFIAAGIWIYDWVEEGRVLRQVIDRLSAESRAAEVVVTKTELDEIAQKVKTTIKFLEYDAQGRPLPAKYFTFQGNVIQFQSLVVRFQDKFIKGGDRLRGKSAYLFLKAFVLDGAKTQEFEITPVHQIPQGYKLPGEKSKFETALWGEFWNYALGPRARERAGIKNAQIEAPGSLFLPGTIYTIRIEHDGGLRIDTQPVPEILKGEKV